MSSQTQAGRRINLDFLHFIVAFITLCFFILISFIGDSGLLDFISSANVEYIRTPVLKQSDGFVQGIIITNRGERLARDIKISVDYGRSNIKEFLYEEMEFQSSPKIVEGGMGDNRVVLLIDTLPEKSRGTMYFSFNGEDSTPTVIVTHGDSTRPEDNGAYRRPLRDVISIYMGLVAIFYILLTSSNNWLKNKRGSV